MRGRTSYLRAAGWIARKDLTADWRARDVSGLMFVFGLLVVILMTMAVDPARNEIRPLLAGLLWIAVFFAGMLGQSRSFAGDAAQGGLDALMMAPVDRSALFLGKMLANLLLLVGMEALLWAAFFLLSQLPWQGHAPAFALVLLLGGAGFASAGTFLAGLAERSRAGPALLPVLLFPLLVPLSLAVVRLSERALAGDPAWESAWWRVLGAYDLVFLVLPLLLFETLLED